VLYQGIRVTVWGGGIKNLPKFCYLIYRWLFNALPLMLRDNTKKRKLSSPSLCYIINEQPPRVVRETKFNWLIVNINLRYILQKKTSPFSTKNLILFVIKMIDCPSEFNCLQIRKKLFCNRFCTDSKYLQPIVMS
jgi:hypothetical protein